jgi:hypothetical protein
MSDDVDLGDRAIATAPVAGESADEIDQPHQHASIQLERAIVQVVVPEHPEGAGWIARLLPVADGERHPRIDHDLVQGFQRCVQSRRLVEEVVWKIAKGVRHAGRIDDWCRKVSDDVGRILVLPRRLHELDDHALVDVVVAALLRVDRAVVETLIRDTLFVFDAETSETADQDERQRSAGWRRPFRVRHRNFAHPSGSGHLPRVECEPR